LTEQVERLKQEKNEAVESLTVVRGQLSVIREEEKQREQEVMELKAEVKRLKLQQLDESKYIEWGPDEIASWIVNLNPKRLQKYEQELASKLVESEVNGKVLSDPDELDAADLMVWGINDRKDRKYVMAEIEKLRANKALNQSQQGAMMEGANAAPTAYM